MSENGKQGIINQEVLKMRPCLKRRFIRKRIAYEASIVLARRKIKDIRNSSVDQKAIDEQKKRIKCFQGLIKQLDLMLDETPRQLEDDHDAKLQGDKRR